VAKTRADNPAIRTLAGEIAKGQTAEITEMRTILGSL